MIRSVDILDDQGNISTRRWYDSNGNAYRDVDMTNHGNSKTHPEYPHEHTWNWSDGIPKEVNNTRKVKLWHWNIVSV